MDTMNSIRSKIFKCVYIVEWIETIGNQRWECRCARSRDVSMCAHGIEFVMFGLHYSTGWRCPNWSYKISATSTMHTMAWPSNRSHQTSLFNEYYSFWMHQYQLTNLNVTSLSCHLINDVHSLSIAIDVVATWHYRFYFSLPSNVQCPNLAINLVKQWEYSIEREHLFINISRSLMFLILGPIKWHLQTRHNHSTPHTQTHTYWYSATYHYYYYYYYYYHYCVE